MTLIIRICKPDAPPEALAKFSDRQVKLATSHNHFHVQAYHVPPQSATASASGGISDATTARSPTTRTTGMNDAVAVGPDGGVAIPHLTTKSYLFVDETQIAQRLTQQHQQQQSFLRQQQIQLGDTTTIAGAAAAGTAKRTQGKKKSSASEDAEEEEEEKKQKKKQQEEQDVYVPSQREIFAAESPEYDRLYKTIQLAAARRENVLVINRGQQYTHSNALGGEIASHLVTSLTPAIEHSLQIVADENAKEKQMQRLLRSADPNTAKKETAESPAAAAAAGTHEQTSEGGNTPQQGGTAHHHHHHQQHHPNSARSQSSTTAAALFRDMSSKTPLSARAPSLLAPSRRPGTAPSSPRMRFLLLNGSREGPVPPTTNANLLLSEKFMSGPQISNDRQRRLPGGRSSLFAGMNGGGGDANDDTSPGGQDSNLQQQQGAFSPQRKSLALQRKSSIAALASLGKVVTPQEPVVLRGNGWPALLAELEFSGDSFLSLPGVPLLDTLMKKFAVDFWMKTPSKINDGKQTILCIGEGNRPEVGMMLHIGMNYAGGEEESMRIYVRDSSNRVFEACVPLREAKLTDGETWNHYEINILSLEESHVQVRINGVVNEHVKLLQTEHPATFNVWVHRLFLGGYLGENEELLAPLKGSIMELRFWKYDTSSLFQQQQQQQQNAAPSPPALSSPHHRGHYHQQQLQHGGSGRGTRSTSPHRAHNHPTKQDGGEYRPHYREPVIRWPLHLESKGSAAAAPSTTAAAKRGHKKRMAGRGAAGSDDDDDGDDDFSFDQDGYDSESIDDDDEANAATPLTTQQQHNTLREATRTIGDGHITTMHNLSFKENQFPPRCCPVFDGVQTYVDMSTLGSFGELMHNFSVDVRFKTAVTSRCMSLLGVTDTQHKMGEVGIILNAEPALTPERYKHHQYQITFVLVDVFGKAMLALVRGTEKQNVMDNRWHTISWKVVDAETNKIEVRVDGQTHEALVMVRDGPKSFMSLRESVFLGGHNVRGHKVRNLFDGLIKNCAVHVRGEQFVQLSLDEGPGASVALDQSGRGIHGLYQAANGDIVRHAMTWVPVFDFDRNGAGQNGRGDQNDSGDGTAQAAAVEMHPQNKVSYALLQFGVRVDGKGMLHESVTNMLSKKEKGSGEEQQEQQEEEVELSMSLSDMVHFHRTDPEHGSEWCELPPSVFQEVETVSKMREDLEYAISRHWGGGGGGSQQQNQHRRGGNNRNNRAVPGDAAAAAATSAAAPNASNGGGGPGAGAAAGGSNNDQQQQQQQREPPCYHGHTLFIIKLGDAMVSLLDLRGPILPPTAIYNTNMLRWQAPLSTLGIEPKRNHYLNSIVSSVENCLLTCSVNPNLPRQLGSATASSRICTSHLLGRLSKQGLPWKLAAVLHNLCVNAYRASVIHNVYSLWDYSTEAAVSSVLVFHNAVRGSAGELATTMIQRNWRGRIARQYTRRLRQLQQLRHARIDDIMKLRKVDPRVMPKHVLRATVITLFCFDSKQIRPIVTCPESESVAAGLELQGYKVNHIENPSRAELMNALQSLNVDEQNFVYIVGYGGNITPQYPKFPSFERLALLISESADREGINLESTTGYAKLCRSFETERGNVIRLAAERSPKKGKKGAISPARAIKRPAAAAAAAAPTSKKAKQQLATAQAAQLAAEEAWKIAFEDLQKLEIEQRVTSVYRQYDMDVGTIVTEHHRLMTESRNFERRFYTTNTNQYSTSGQQQRGQQQQQTGSGAASERLPPSELYLLARDATSFEPRPIDLLNIRSIADAALHRVPPSTTPPRGLQAVLCIDMSPYGAHDAATGACYFGSSVGHEFVVPYQPAQRNILSWQLTKALMGHTPALEIKGADAILSGSVKCYDPDYRDWKSCAHYLVRKVTKKTGGTAEVAKRRLGYLNTDTEYIADLVPLRKEPTTRAQRDSHRKESELKRVTGSVTVLVDATSVSFDLASELRHLVPSLNISDVVQLPEVVLQFNHNNRHLSLVDTGAIEGEVAKCCPKEVIYEVSIDSRGCVISLACESSKTKLTQAMNAISTRSVGWHFAPRELQREENMALIAQSASAYKLLDVIRCDFTFNARGNTYLRKWKHVPELFRDENVLSKTMRLTGYSLE